MKVLQEPGHAAQGRRPVLHTVVDRARQLADAASAALNGGPTVAQILKVEGRNIDTGIPPSWIPKRRR